MASPDVGIVGTMRTLSGAPRPGGTIAFSLSNFDGFVPVVMGSNVVVPEAQTAVIGNDGTFSISLYGNYQVSPSNTYYQVTITDASGAFVSSSAYQLMNAGTFDLSTLSPIWSSLPTPMFPGPAGPRGPSGLSYVNKAATIFEPAIGDSGRVLLIDEDHPIYITRIYGATQGDSTVVPINLEVRNEAAIDTAGTEVMITALDCTPGGASWTGSAAVAANSPVVLTIPSAMTGAPSTLRVVVEYSY